MINRSDAIGIEGKISMTELLSRLGIKPSKKLGNEILYDSVFGIAEKGSRNSFRINDDLDVWFDKCLGKGGNIIDFGLAYWQNFSVEQVRQKINELSGGNSSEKAVIHPTGRPRKAVKIPHYHVQNIMPVGGNSQICAFLLGQNLSNISNSHLKEVYYYVVDEKGTRKDFFSAGWQNENGGWEVRYWCYSGCIGPRGMTFIPGQDNRLVLFENFTDYLNWQDNTEPTDPNILVLNSIDFLRAAIHRASRYSDLSVLLTSDKMKEDFWAGVNMLKNKHSNN